MTFLAGQIVTADALNALIGWVEQAREDTDLTGITSTSFASGSPVCGLAFEAPASGSVLVTVGGRLANTAGTTASFLGWVLATGTSVGSGTEVVGASIERAVGHEIGAGSYSYLVTGLTPGDDYNVCTQHRAGAGCTVSIFHRSVIVQAVVE